MKTKLYTIFFLVLMSKTINAQGLPQVVPPSPEASALFKFNEIPVSLSNGLHNTSIPLLEISSGGLTIPISLSYHSRGVQVNEIASRVGTGWALSYGGMISRQIRGLPDDSTFGYWNNNNSTQNFYQDYDSRLSELNTVRNQQYDYYPDKFMISTNFFSGEFYFDKNSNTLITQKFSDVKIIPQYDAGKIIGFQVTDNQGNNYFFGNVDVTNINPSQFSNEHEWVETTYTFNSSGLQSSIGNNTNFEYSSWFLKKIITSTNEVIEFMYEDETTSYIRRSEDKDQYTETVFYDAGQTTEVVHPVTCHFSKIQSHQKRLSAIHFDGGRVEFIESAETREDLLNGYSLDKIKLFNKNNQCVKQIQLNYFYTHFTGIDNINSNNVLLNDVYAKKRLFLESVEFKDSLGVNIEKSYQFEYDDQDLPSRHSNSIDFWGYYNGKNRGNFINWGNTDYDDAVVDPIKIQAGLLNKIIYPTGGYTTFEYEPNVVLNKLPLSSVSFQNASITYPLDYIIPNTNPVIPKNVILSYIEPNRYNLSTGRYEIPVIISPFVRDPFEINLSQCDFNFTCQLINNNTGQIYNFGSSLGLISVPTIQPGTYTFVFDPIDRDWDPYANGDLENTLAHMFIVTMQWKEIVDGDKIYAPGNRIKKISNFTANSFLEFSKLYTYVNESNNAPNGLIFSTSNFRVKKYMVGQFPFYDNSSYQLGGVFSSSSKDVFAYHTVCEYFMDKNNQSKDKIKHEYSLTKDFGSYYLFPSHPISDNDWLRGLDLKKTFYKKENNIYRKVREINNNYILNNTDLISLEEGYYGEYIVGSMYYYEIENQKAMTENFQTYPYVRSRTVFTYPNSTGVNLNHYVYNSPVVFGYRTSFFTGGTLDLSTTKETEYFDNGQEMETVTTYGYDYNNHYNVASVSTTNSTSETIETKYFYPQDPEMATKPFINSLKDKNIVGVPLITETFKNGEKLSTVETQYKNWNNVLLAPEFIKASKGSAPLETRVIFNSVDPVNGNPLQVQKEGGITICYIWGYNKTQPIAKIENATYSQIQQYEANLQTLSNGTNEASLITALNSLRTALPNAMVTTYTYKPLVGISTVTDPKGDKQTYHYDGFNRLQFVKDAQGNILSENQYHYRTQN